MFQIPRYPRMSPMRGKDSLKLIDRWVGVPLVWFLGLRSKLLNKPFDKPLGDGDHLLVVKLSALGDTLLLLPVLKALKKRVGPHGRVVAVATSINEAAFRYNPWIDRLIVVDFRKLMWNPLSFLALMGQLKQEKIHVALDFDQWLRISPILCFFSGAPFRFGFKTKGQGRHFLYNSSVPNEKGRHESEQFADVAFLAGLNHGNIEDYPGFLKREKLFGLAQGKSSGPNQKPLIHFHPGCGVHGWQRAWPVESYAQLAQKLYQGLGASFRLTGMGDYEEGLAKQILEKSGLEMDNRCGILSLPELTKLLEEADLVVCGNTGVMHLVVGLEKPLVALHGPTDPVKWGPGSASAYALVERDPARPVGQDWEEIKGQKSSMVRVLRANLPCSPCLNLGFEYGCKARPCMEGIEVNVVYRECLAALAKYSNESVRIN
jgi:heptosyltransferase III